MTGFCDFNISSRIYYINIILGGGHIYDDAQTEDADSRVGDNMLRAWGTAYFFSPDAIAGNNSISDFSCGGIFIFKVLAKPARVNIIYQRELRSRGRRSAPRI